MAKSRKATFGLRSGDAADVLDMLDTLDLGLLTFDLNGAGREVLIGANAAARQCFEVGDDLFTPGADRASLTDFFVARGDLDDDFSADAHIDDVLNNAETSTLARMPSGRVVRCLSRRRAGGGSLVLCTDVSTQVRDRSRMRELEARCEAVLASTPTGIVRVDPLGHASYANPAALALFDVEDVRLSEAEALGAIDVVRRLVPADGSSLAARLFEGHRFEAEIALPAMTRHVMISISPRVTVEGVSTQVLSLTDITPLKEARSRIEFLARHDHLTGLGNRAQLNAAWDRIEPQIAQGGRCVHLLALDLDHFKRVNDEHGHGVGDLLLKEVADRLHRCVGAQCQVFRFGGDEFLVLLDGASRREAIETAERIVACLGLPADVAGHKVQIGCSVGIASAPLDGVSRDQIHRAADLALYVVKRSGRNGVACFDPVQEQAMLDRRLLQSDLALAIANEEFHLVFQRQVDPVAGRVTGLEALVRWHNRRLDRLVPPDEFIPLAEQAGLVSLIDLWVARRAVADFARLKEAGCEAVALAVNLSALTLAREDACTILAAILAEHSLMPSALEIDIAEIVAVTETGSLAISLRRLREMGVRVAIDDFGSGQTSFGYLQSLCVERIKLDPSLIRHLGRDDGSAPVVAAIWEFCRRLDLALTAEGVETAEQWSALRAIGPIQGQGFFLGKPETADQILSRLAGTDIQRQA
ncbi:bifunctional diguanylate cyclase/phosphodiesterase [Aureimonas sp. AU12]|uniref:putative bifunctional diguanylate cyclase/phosphodiesterase n=1 Tax=Aureimonas sp. AU12 TaxID=1638161 RepID=UPI0007840033|nr:EAL domain-containing protein [Aureimonas sp. AU12]